MSAKQKTPNARPNNELTQHWLLLRSANNQQCVVGTVAAS